MRMCVHICIWKGTRYYYDRYACSRSSMANGLKLVRLECWWKDTRGVGGECVCGVEADKPGVARVVSWMSSAPLALAEEQSLV